MKGVSWIYDTPKSDFIEIRILEIKELHNKRLQNLAVTLENFPAIISQEHIK